jgi:hypothetical protein
MTGRHMNSSTSASDGHFWRRLLQNYAIMTVAAVVVVLALLLAIDPYDTGRFAVLPSRGVPDFGQRLSLASIARRPDIDGAIFGNSTIQLLDPARLSRLTGRRFVSLAVPGSGPLEQLAIADWFRRQHRGVSNLAYVFDLDASWCTTERPIPLANPFPFWLYGRSWLTYVLNMMRYKSLEASIRKTKMLFGLEREAARDGYHDYDTGHAWRTPDLTVKHADLANASRTGTDFSAPPLLERFLTRLAPDAKLVLVVVPRHASTLPHTAVEARQLASCKDSYRRIANAMPGAIFLDFLVDNAMTRNDENFWDAVHYRKPVAQTLEDQIASALNSLTRSLMTDLRRPRVVLPGP